MTGSIRIVYIITRADTIAGAQRHVFEMSEKMSQEGHHVTVVCGEKGPYTEFLAQNNITFINISSLVRELDIIKDVKTLFALMMLLRRIKPDLVSTHSSKAGLLGRIACKIIRIPVIFTAHGWSFTDGVEEKQRNLYRRVEKILSYISDKIICVSNSDRNLAIEAGISPAKLVTIHNGRHELKNPFKENKCVSDTTKIIMIGRLDQQKDHVTLFKSIEGLKDIDLVLLGDGPNLDKLQKLAESLNISDVVCFKGLTTNVVSFLQNADIFVLISNWEGFPRSTLEAMRAGLPVIVSDVGGSSEAVVEGLNGYTIPRGDYVTLRQRLQELCQSQSKRTEMGLAGQQLFKKKFTFTRMYNNTWLEYRRLLT